MDHYGFWGLVPPFLSIVMAFVTKEVFISLFAGILSGALIVAGGNVLQAMLNLTDLIMTMLSDSWNIRIFIFCALLGGLVGILSRTGSAGAFGKWASKNLKTARSTQFVALIFDALIFIDDYFNTLTVGTIMRPISDKTKSSRAKLAYILDSTAAPVCILAPVSSWVVTVMSIIRSSDGFSKLGVNELHFFISSIPFNLYAILTIVMVVVVIATGRDFGPMARSERRAREGMLFDTERYGATSGDIVENENKNACVFDMLFPLIVLIASAVIFFPLTTWTAAVKDGSAASISAAMQSISIGRAFSETDASVALMYAIMATIVLTYIYYLSRRLMTLKIASDALRDGIASMVPALVTLTLAWTIGTLIKSPRSEGGLGLGRFLSEFVISTGFPLAFIPFIAFVMSAIISFATGTSWGTFGIMIPIVMPIATSVSDGNMLTMTLISVSATLSGAVFGDHASPISDTTILSSTGACCPHLEHVSTQLPYVLFIAGCSGVGFLVSGITSSIVFGWLFAVAAFVFGNIILPCVVKDN